jgi:hypothetical protein
MVDTTPPVPDPGTVNASTNALVNNNTALERQASNIEKNVQYMSQLNERMDTARNILDMLGNFVTKGADAFGKLSTSVSNYMDELNNSADLTTSAMTKMGLAITGVVGASEAFKNAGNFEGLTTFSGQINDLVDAAGGALDKLQGLSNSMGLKVPNAILQSAEALGKFIKNTALSADYSLKAEDVYIKLAARTGELGKGYLDLANSTQHINQAVQNQISQFTAASKATNISIDDAQKYYMALKAIPDRLNSMTESGQHTSGSVEYLTKTIQLARGAGRDYSDVVDDMHQAVRNYNDSLPEALRFTEQISEISKNYHVELEDVRKSLIGTSDALKMFGNEGDGAAAILNQYVGSLKATGISGAVATDIVGNMTRQLGQLTIAQKAFISAQSGGAGGLQGSFQIDNLLRQKDGLQKVFEMTKNQMTKMMGPLVSVKEAAESPQAAAQMTKQILMLRQGPLGQFARSDAEAERIIEAFKSGKSADFKELAKGQEGVNAVAKTGNELAMQSNTYLKSIRDMIAEARGEAAGAMINLYQTGTTAGAGFEPETYNDETIQDQKAFLRGNMAAGATASTQPANGVRVINDFVTTLQDAPNAVKAALHGISRALTPEGAQEREKTLAQFMAEQEARKKEVESLPETMKAMEMQSISRNEESAKKLVSLAGQNTAQSNVVSSPTHSD